MSSKREFWASPCHRWKFEGCHKQWWVGTTHCQLGKLEGSRWAAGVVSRGRRKNVYPVAGTVRGHSSETPGPWTPIHRVCQTSLTTSPPRFLHLAFVSSLYLALFNPTHHPSHTTMMRPHCYQGSIGGNDLLWQGQRRPHQYLR